MTWPAVLLAAYPADWRARYGDELEQLVTDLREHGRRPAALAFDAARPPRGSPEGETPCPSARAAR